MRFYSKKKKRVHFIRSYPYPDLILDSGIGFGFSQGSDPDREPVFSRGKDPRSGSTLSGSENHVFRNKSLI